jgi:hypothetical protein
VKRCRSNSETISYIQTSPFVEEVHAEISFVTMDSIEKRDQKKKERSSQWTTTVNSNKDKIEEIVVLTSFAPQHNKTVNFFLCERSRHVCLDA